MSYYTDKTACWAGKLASQQPHRHAVGDDSGQHPTMTDERGRISTPFAQSHGSGYSLTALAAMEGFGPTPLPRSVLGGRRTAVVHSEHRLVGNHGKVPAMDMRTMTPAYMWSTLPRYLADAQPLP